MKRRILLIEDDPTLNRLLASELGHEGFEVATVDTWVAADAWLAAHEPHLLVADVRLPDADTLERLRAEPPDYPVVLLTAYGSIRHAVEAMKAGAVEYLVKPVNTDALLMVIRKALEQADLRREHQFCLRCLKAKEGNQSFMVGVSEALEGVKDLVEAVAPSEMSVLVQGESGSGKELVARAIHDHSPRAKRTFVAVDCCTLQEKLFESELFGHERGAFTGAERQKKGLIEGAEGGTLFLDEIGEIEPSIQAKLLRVLETGKFRRIGGTRDLDANVRVVAATNRDLEAMSQEGTFRADLYFRLSGFIIETPPLRERRDDIPYLVEHFLHHHNFSRRVNKTFSKAAIRELVAYDWPGNVRELKNVVERAVILSRDKKTIRPEHLTFGRSSRQAKVTLSFDHDPTMEELEAAYLRLQLEKQSGRRARVAEVLDVSERNIYRLIKRYDLANA